MIFNKEFNGICKILWEYRFHEPPSPHVRFDHFSATFLTFLEFFRFSTLYRDVWFLTSSNSNSARKMIKNSLYQIVISAIFFETPIPEFGGCFAPLPLHAEDAPSFSYPFRFRLSMARIILCFGKFSEQTKSRFGGSAANM